MDIEEKLQQATEPIVRQIRSLKATEQDYLLAILKKELEGNKGDSHTKDTKLEEKRKSYSQPSKQEKAANYWKKIQKLYRSSREYKQRGRH